MAKAKRKPRMVVNTTRNAERQKARVARKFGNTGAFLKKHTARAVRRDAGDFKPVNEAASLAQHPDGKFAKNYSKKKPVTVNAAMQAVNNLAAFL